jgi:hypothetical protein
MVVPVPINMIERQPGTTKGVKLGADLGFRLIAHLARQGKANAAAHRSARQSAVLVDKVRNGAPGEDRLTCDKRQVEPDSQGRQPPRATDRILCGGASHHQTR